jgi:hypothetical protein
MNADYRLLSTDFEISCVGFRISPNRNYFLQDKDFPFLPLEVRGRKGGYFHNFITPLAPLILRLRSGQALRGGVMETFFVPRLLRHDESGLAMIGGVIKSEACQFPAPTKIALALSCLTKTIRAEIAEPAPSESEKSR